MHVSVLARELIDNLQINPDATYIDGTLGAGGHSSLILAKLSKNGRLFSFDQDQSAIDLVQATKSGSDNWTLVHRNFSQLDEFYAEQKSINPDFKIDGGLALDLGVSSMQFDQQERGFSFNKEAALDMRMDKEQDFTAEDFVNGYSEKDIADVLFQYGDERLSRQIATEILRHRPIKTTLQLAELIKKVYARKSKGKTFKIHPATRSFQAIRVFVNDELDALAKVLNLAPAILEQNAIVAVLSFQSQEDRLVKKLFRDHPAYELITRKPIEASEEEIIANPRARSVKMRVARIKKNTDEHQ